MVGTRKLGRIVAIGIALVVMLLWGLVAEARAGRSYTVAQCGWYVGIDADWGDTTGAAKFRPDAYCVPPGGGDPIGGSHVKTFTTGAETLSGNRFGRWRWLAPAGTFMTQIRGTWWHALHDGFQQRVGSVNFGGGFDLLLLAGAPDAAVRDFVIDFPAPVAGIEDRLLCAKGEDKSCSLAVPSWSSLRALTFTLVDAQAPGGGIGGEILAPGWLHGVETALISGTDVGSGVRFGETLLDGARVALTEYPCAVALIAGEWRGARMQPCAGGASGSQAIQTTAFSDGPHSLEHCIHDFAGNPMCTGPLSIRIDNNPPAQVRSLTVAGGEGWHRSNDFDLTWVDPEQAPASPIVGASWRLTGSAGYDTGARFAAVPGRVGLADLRVPGPGSYPLSLWLRDEAGNEAAGSAATVSLRFDDVAPVVGFAGGEGDATGPQLVAFLADAHSGPAGGTILFQRAGGEHWTELPTKLLAGERPGSGELRAPMPDLGPGVWVFRADAIDAAGNSASGNRRADGSAMVVRVGVAAARADAAGEKTRLFARLLPARSGLRGRGARVKTKGETITVGFGELARVRGRLTDARGVGLADRELRVVSRPSRGALARTTVASVRSGKRGGFELELPAGTSRRVTVRYAGAERLDPARRGPLGLRVRARVSLRAAPLLLRTGEEVRLSGRVVEGAAALPRRGKVVAIQYLEEATGRWRPVLVTRTDHDGRFRTRYRFRYVDGTASIRLRASALAEERWPYAPGSSRSVTVDVRGR